MISKKINYVICSKNSDRFLEIEYGKINKYRVKDLLKLNVNYQNEDTDDLIFQIIFMERIRSIKNHSELNLIIYNKIEPNNKIFIDNEQMNLNVYFDSYEISIEYKKNRYKTLTIHKKNENIDANNKPNEIPLNQIIKANNHLESIPIKNTKLKESESNINNDKNSDKLINSISRYDVLKNLPLNFQINTDADLIERSINHEDHNENIDNNSNNNYKINEKFLKLDDCDKYDYKDLIFKEISNNKSKNLIDLNPEFNINEVKTDILKGLSPFKLNNINNNLPNIAFNKNKVIIDDYETLENSVNYSKTKRIQNYKEEKFNNASINRNLMEDRIFQIFEENGNLITKNGKTKTKLKLEEKENLQDNCEIKPEDDFTFIFNENKYNLRRKKIIENNKNKKIIEDFTDKNENNYINKTSRNIKDKSKLDLKLINENNDIRIEEDSNIFNDGKYKSKDLNNKNINRKNSTSINGSTSIYDINKNVYVNNNEKIKNSYLENLKNSNLLVNENIQFNTNGKRLRSKKSINNKDEQLDKDNNLNEDYQINQINDFLLNSEFKTKKLKKNKSKELDLPLNAQCPICIEGINNLANLDNCNHYFCKNCIMLWSKKTNLCPMCKKEFKKIIYYEKGKPKEYKVKKRRLEIEDVMEEEDFNELIEEPFRDQNCQICNRGHDEDNLLVCDGCGANVCHTYCDGLSAVPEGDWYCIICRKTIVNENHCPSSNNNINNSNNVRRNDSNDTREKITNNSRNSNINQNRNSIINRNNRNNFLDDEACDESNISDESYNESSEEEEDDEFDECSSEVSLVDEEDEDESFIENKFQRKRQIKKNKVKYENKKLLNLIIKDFKNKLQKKNSKRKWRKRIKFDKSSPNPDNNKNSEKLEIYNKLEKLDEGNYEEDLRLEKLKNNFIKLKKDKLSENKLSINEILTDKSHKDQFEFKNNNNNFNIKNNKNYKIPTDESYIELEYDTFSKNINDKKTKINKKEINMKNIKNSLPEDYLQYYYVNSEEEKNYNIIKKNLIKKCDKNSKNNFKPYENKSRKKEINLNDFENYIYEEEKNCDIQISQNDTKLSSLNNNKNLEILNKINHNEKNFSFFKNENESNKIKEKLNSNNMHKNNSHIMDNICTRKNSLIEKEKSLINFKNQIKSKYESGSDSEEDYLEKYAKEKNVNKK